MPMSTMVVPPTTSITGDPLDPSGSERWEWWQRELDFILTIPLVTSDGSYGDIQLPENLPSAESVVAFMQVLTQPYVAVERYPAIFGGEGEFMDAAVADVPEWYQFPEGALSTDNIAALVESACKILSSYGAGHYVYDLRKNRSTPDGWGGQAPFAVAGDFRSLLDRLFDRLHVNHTKVTSGARQGVFRTACVHPNPDGGISTWAGEVFAPQTTFFCTERGLEDIETSDPFLLRMAEANQALATVREHLHRSSDECTTLLGLFLGGLESPPDCWAFPLDFRQANLNGLFGGAPLTLDDETKAQFADLLPDIEDAVALFEEIAGAGENIEDEFPFWTWVARRLGLDDKAADTELFAGVTAEDFVEGAADIADTLESVKRHIERVSGEESASDTLSDSLYYLLSACDGVNDIFDRMGEIGLDGLGFGRLWDGYLQTVFGKADLGDLAAGFYPATFSAIPEAFDSPREFDGDATVTLMPQMVVLGGPILDHSIRYNQFYSSDEEQVEASAPVPDPPYNLPIGSSPLYANGEYALTIWDLWYARVSPTLDAARAFDTAGIVAQQLVNLDDLTLALFREKEGSGSLADGILGILDDVGQPWRLDLNALVTFTPGEVVRYLVRQLATDLFIEHMVRHKGADREQLYTLFCWMDSEDNRSNIDLALGELREVELPEAYLEFIQDAGWGNLYDTAIEGAPTVWIRGCMLPPESAVNPLAGGLGAVAEGFLDQESLENDIAFALQFGIGVWQLGLWLSDARESCLPALYTKPDWEPVNRWEEVAEVVKDGARQWVLNGGLQVPLTGVDDFLADFRSYVDRVAGALDLPEASMSPVMRAMLRQRTESNGGGLP